MIIVILQRWQQLQIMPLYSATHSLRLTDKTRRCIMQYLISLLNNIRSASEIPPTASASAVDKTLDEDAHLHNSALWKAAAQQTAFDIIRF